MRILILTLEGLRPAPHGAPDLKGVLSFYVFLARSIESVWSYMVENLHVDAFFEISWVYAQSFLSFAKHYPKNSSSHSLAADDGPSKKASSHITATSAASKGKEIVNGGTDFANHHPQNFNIVLQTR